MVQLQNKTIKTNVEHRNIGHEGYEISLEGNLWSEPRLDARGRKVPGGYLKSKDNGLGYRYFQIKVQGKIKNFYAHRLVALAFLAGRTEERNTVDHIDRNPSNNHLSNLRWVTNRENTSHHKTDPGVSLSTGKKWRVDIRLHKSTKQTYLGIFEDKDEALGVYQKALHIINNNLPVQMIQDLKEQYRRR